MKDLLLYVADADAWAFMKSILEKPRALGIRLVTYDIKRHPMRDSGMVQSGAELVRMQKNRYDKALMIWDHHGSGRDHKKTPEAVQDEIQDKLDAFTWKDNSAVCILVPELEQWVWFCESALLAHYNVTAAQLNCWIEERSRQLKMTESEVKALQPKELFEFVVRDRLNRTISPRDFEEIGKRAGIKNLMTCTSFQTILERLRTWFPDETEG
jgi:hypothetical protein